MNNSSLENINYIVGIRKKSINGDSIHVNGIKTFSNFHVKYTRNPFVIHRLLKLQKTVIREHPLLSMYLLFMDTSNVYLEINGSLFDEWGKGPLKFISLKIQKFLLNKTAGNIFVSQGLLERFKDLKIIIHNNNYVIPNAGDYGIYKLPTETIPNSIGYVGAITEWQDLDQLLTMLSKDGNNFTLFIISKDVGQLKSYKNIEIIDMGNSSPEKVNYLYNICEYILIPDNRIYKDYFLSSSIKLHQAVFLEKKLITLKHTKGLIMQEFNKPICYCVNCYKDSSNGSLKYRSWSDVCTEIEKIIS